MSTQGISSHWRARSMLGGLMLLLTLGLVGLGVLLSNTYGASQVAANAKELHWTNATLGASGIARAAIAQGVFFSYEDISDADGKERAIAEARANLATVQELVGSIDGPTGTTHLGTIADFVGAGNDAIDLAAAGRSAEAEALRLTAVEPAYEGLRSELTTRQNELARSIADSDEESGRIARITFVAISFFIPAVAMVVLWVVLRRRVRERETEMRGMIDAEKELNRAKDEFIAGLSHELRTPLTSIVGFTDLLLQNASLEAEAAEQVAMIHSSSSDLTRMVEDLLVAARIDAGALSVDPARLDLAHQVRIALSAFTLSPAQIHVQIPSLEVFADALHLRQIIQNLVSNAIRHGGDRILVSAAERGDSVALVVADDGPGVSPDVESRLFQRFVHEGKQALVAGSIGLGLAISQELARRMNGELRYVRADDWTTFTLFVPRISTEREETLDLALARQ